MIPGISNNSLRYEARKALSRALAGGDLPPAHAQSCKHCGIDRKTFPGVRMVWHHTDYNSPLDVIALCAKCHAAEHKREDKANSQTTIKCSGQENQSGAGQSLQVRMSEGEKALLVKISAEYGLSISAFVRMMVTYFDDKRPTVAVQFGPHQ